MSKKKNQIIKFKTLKKTILKNKSVMFMYTNKGILLSKECVKNRSGGFMTYQVLGN